MFDVGGCLCVVWKIGISYGYCDVWVIGSICYYMVGVWVGWLDGMLLLGQYGVVIVLLLMFEVVDSLLCQCGDLVVVLMLVGVSQEDICWFIGECVEGLLVVLCQCRMLVYLFDGVVLLIFLDCEV